MSAVPPLLVRAGFQVDIVSLNKLTIKSSKSTHITRLKKNDDLLKAVLKLPITTYDMVIAGDDESLGKVLNANIPINLKLKLLPVTAPQHFRHLYSKTGLSQVLDASQVSTPPYRVVHNPNNLSQKANEIGYPLLVKLDASSGGVGVYECNTSAELSKLDSKKLQFPVLIQKKIEGDLIDLSGLFQNGKLIHFSHSTYSATTHGKFSPSSARLYTQLSEINHKILDELSEIGKKLGINGFANLSCIHSTSDGKRYYFEADLRPTVWADSSRHIGNDTALALSSYFQSGSTLNKLPRRNADFPTQTTIPYLPRLTLREIFTNQHNCWSHLNPKILAQVTKKILVTNAKQAFKSSRK